MAARSINPPPVASPGSYVSTRNPRSRNTPQPAWYRHLAAAIGTGIVALLASWFLTAPADLGRSTAPALLAATTAPIPADRATTSTALAVTAPEPPDPFKKTVAPFLKTFCHECHGPETDNGGLRLDKFSSTKVFPATENQDGLYQGQTGHFREQAPGVTAQCPSESLTGISVECLEGKFR